MRNESKLEKLELESTMQGAFNFNGCNKLEKNSSNNILAMKVSAVLKFNSKRYKLCAEEIDVTEELQIVRLLL